MKAICPGSFDPVTNGHLDVFTRAAKIADEVVVAVLVNRSKAGMFSVEERIEILTDVTADLPNVRIDSFHGLLVDYCRDNGIQAIVKGAPCDQRFRLRAADGPDEPPAGGGRNPVRFLPIRSTATCPRA